MLASALRTGILLVSFALFAPAAIAGDKDKKPTDKEVAKAKLSVDDRLEELKANKAKVEAITDEALAKTFPDYIFFAVHFPQWPLAVAPPKPLTSANVFAVDKERKLKHFTDFATLEPFFRNQLDAINDDQRGKRVVRAFLRLMEEFAQDGFYKFDIPDKELVVSTENAERVVTGKAVVVPERGNKGEIVVTMTFGITGMVQKIAWNQKLVRGMRPKCQATKLLDPDPLVRFMAEQDLLVIGQAGREYLRQQRSKASPELRRAIDRIWAQILAEGR
jgi:hypothetical protein